MDKSIKINKVKNTKVNRKPQNSIPTTAAICRSAFFLPTIKNKKKIRDRKFLIKIKEIDYRIKELGISLTELHNDILEAILISKKYIRETKKGFEILYSLHDIYKTLNKRISESKIKNKIQELRAITYFIEDTQDNFKYLDFNILSGSKLSGIKYSNGKGMMKGRANYYYQAIIDKKYLEFTELDLKIFINEDLLKKIIDLKSGIVKHLVRYCLSQKELNKDLEDILYEIGVINDETLKQYKYEYKKEILDNKDIIFNNFGIEIKKMKNGRYGIFYNKINKVYFKNPIQLIEHKQSESYKTSLLLENNPRNYTTNSQTI